MYFAECCIKTLEEAVNRKIQKFLADFSMLLLVNLFTKYSFILCMYFGKNLHLFAISHTSRAYVKWVPKRPYIYIPEAGFEPPIANSQHLLNETLTR